MSGRARLVGLGAVVVLVCLIAAGYGFGRYGTVRGVAIGEGGGPLGGLLVTVEPPTIHPRPRATSASTKTAADGSFVLRWVRAGEYDVSAFLPEQDSYRFARREAQRVHVSRFGTARVRLEFTRKLTISGFVRDQFGRPIAGAHVSGGVPIGTREAAFRANRSVVTYPESEATTAADGRFELVGLTAGTYRLFALAEDHGHGHDLTVQAGSRDATLTLPYPGALRGRVVDSAGNPIPEFWFGTRLVQAADGRFRLDRRPTDLDRTEIAARDKASEMRTTPASLADRFGDIDLGTIVLGSGRTVRGVVREVGSGRPILGAVVHLKTSLARNAPRYFGCHETAERYAAAALPMVRTGADGTFVFEHFPNGAAAVAATHPAYLTGEAAVGGGEACVTIELGRGASISGTVLDAVGRGVPEARVQLRRLMDPEAERQPPLEARTNADGGYEFQGLMAGRFALEVWPVTYSVPEKLDHFRYQENLTVTSGQQLRRDLRPRAGGTNLVVRLPMLLREPRGYLMPHDWVRPSLAAELWSAAREGIVGGWLERDPLVFRSVPAGRYALLLLDDTSDGLRLTLRPVTVAGAPRQVVETDMDDAVLIKRER